MKHIDRNACKHASRSSSHPLATTRGDKLGETPDTVASPFCTDLQPHIARLRTPQTVPPIHLFTDPSIFGGGTTRAPLPDALLEDFGPDEIQSRSRVSIACDLTPRDIDLRNVAASTRADVVSGASGPRPDRADRTRNRIVDARRYTEWELQIEKPGLAHQPASFSQRVRSRKRARIDRSGAVRNWHTHEERV